MPESVPVPDPTTLTTDLLRRETGALRDSLETRIDGVDAAIVHLRELTNAGLEAAYNSRTILFAGIDKQFAERDIRSAASEDAAKLAVNAALLAQKEATAAQNASNYAAISKSEVATTKQIDSIVALLASNTGALSDKLVATNARLDRGDGVKTGISASLTSALAVGAVLVSMLGVGISLFNIARDHNGGVTVSPPATVQSR